MKKLFYFLTILAITSCNRDDNPDPSPDLSVLEKHQAPFGSAKIDVKLIKVLRDSQVGVEYIYDGDLLSEEKRHDGRSFESLYQTGIFKRINGLPESYKVASVYYNDEGDYVDSPFRPYFSLNFAAPKSDSLSYVTDTRFFSGPSTYYRAYAFDKTGYITRQEFWSDVKSVQPDITMYVRDAQHNISRSWSKIAVESEKSEQIEYSYDNHPNPFFKLGMDWNGDISVQSLSPNNITKKTYSSPVSSTYYDYEYLPNGYPAKVTVRVQSSITQPYSYSLEFIYK